jgi:hypothetical protein
MHHLADPGRALFTVEGERTIAVSTVWAALRP